MTSERQKAANRANALQSTGPKTREGKAAVRLNAIRHGLLARDAVLPGEDADAFEQLWNEVHDELTIRAQRLAEGILPLAKLRLTSAQKWAYKAPECLG